MSKVNPANNFLQNTHVLTLKITSHTPEIISKLLADERSRFKPITASALMYNNSTGEYYAFLNILETEIADKLQEISPFPSFANPVGKMGQ